MPNDDRAIANELERSGQKTFKVIDALVDDAKLVIPFWSVFYLFIFISCAGREKGARVQEAYHARRSRAQGAHAGQRHGSLCHVCVRCALLADIVVYCDSKFFFFIKHDTERKTPSSLFSPPLKTKRKTTQGRTNYCKVGGGYREREREGNERRCNFIFLMHALCWTRLLPWIRHLLPPLLKTNHRLRSAGLRVRLRWRLPVRRPLLLLPLLLLLLLIRQRPIAVC